MISGIKYEDLYAFGWGGYDRPEGQKPPEPELVRLSGLLEYERELLRQADLVIGLDEVGRGPIAGPVVAAAVIWPPNPDVERLPAGLNDSKKLSEKKRYAMEPLIKQGALAWGIGVVGARDIDRLNILQATKLAMLRALVKLPLGGVVQGWCRLVQQGMAEILGKPELAGLWREWRFVPEVVQGAVQGPESGGMAGRSMEQKPSYTGLAEKRPGCGAVQNEQKRPGLAGENEVGTGQNEYKVQDSEQGQDIQFGQSVQWIQICQSGQTIQNGQNEQNMQFGQNAQGVDIYQNGQKMPNLPGKLNGDLKKPGRVHLLLDALTLPVELPQTGLVKGDAKSASIAAASILAKCYRDRLMGIYDRMYPGYGLAGHAGYPTAAHKQAVWALGYSPIHRRSFVLRPLKQHSKQDMQGQGKKNG